MARFGRIRARYPLAVVLAAAAIPAALAFDTGHHADLTYEALQSEGFGPSAIQVVQVENWLTDYYSGPMGKVPFLRADLGKLTAEFAAIEPEVAKLHFDNLQDTEQVRNSWGWLTSNTKAAVQDAARRNDVLHGLALIGLSIHAVQDFYTHSNWVEAINGTSGNVSVLKTATFSTDPDSASKLRLWTGSYPPERTAPPPLSPQQHGGYFAGMNHDSYVRPNWLPAYVAAYAASREWVSAIHAWVNEVDSSGAYWRSLQTYRPSSDDQRRLDTDLEATYRIAEWVKSGDHDGHWKGNGSGSAEFVPYVAVWALKTDSPYVGEVKEKRAQRQLINNLNSDGNRVPPVPAASAVPALSKVSLPRQALLIRTLHAKRLGLGFIPPVANMFATVRISGPGFDYTFKESMQYHNPDISPKWTTIKFLPDASAPVNVEYRLINEGGPLAGSDMTYGVNGQSVVLKFRVNPQDGSCSGDLSGRPDGNKQTVATFKGSGRTTEAEAEVTIAVQVVPVG